MTQITLISIRGQLLAVFPKLLEVILNSMSNIVFFPFAPATPALGCHELDFTDISERNEQLSPPFLLPCTVPSIESREDLPAGISSSTPLSADALPCGRKQFPPLIHIIQQAPLLTNKRKCLHLSYVIPSPPWFWGSLTHILAPRRTSMRCSASHSHCNLSCERSGSGYPWS